MSQTVKFNEPDEVLEFVNAASRCDFDIDIFTSYNRMIVDAKSILGIMSMGIAHAMHVRCHGENKEFEQVLKKYAVG